MGPAKKIMGARANPPARREAYVPVNRRAAASFVTEVGEGITHDPPSGVRRVVRSAEAISTQKLPAQRGPAPAPRYTKALGVDSRLLAAAHLVTWVEREALDAVAALEGPCEASSVAARLGGELDETRATLERLVRRGLIALR
ncbi:MAG: hypothetical protein IPK71_03865 [Myxococcales bacterium]|nr:hypothetical protein [Myxococcales bacterium]